jgi:hypothetical protein
MAKEMATESWCDCCTICLPVSEEQYGEIVEDAENFREFLDECYQHMPELFPEDFARGYEMKDCRTPKKLPFKLRRITLRNGKAYTIRPSFLMPYITARTEEIEKPLFLRKFGVPFWALTYVFGRNPMFWYRLESNLGRFSVAGTTVRRGPLPRHLLADEHHQTCGGKKQYLATTVGGGCCLGVAVAETASTEDLQAAYAVFQREARNIDPEYAPQTVNTDGWKGTQAAWRALFPMIVVLRCFLHAWLKIRDRAKHLQDQFAEIATRVWDAYRAPNRRSFAQHLRALQTWAQSRLTGVVLASIQDLCGKRDQWSLAYDHPQGHRTSNMLDRIMRGMNRYFFNGQHLHGYRQTSERHSRAWALLWNFAPWHPAVASDHKGWMSPAEQLNKYRYHNHWLQNLLVSASLGGYRQGGPQKT